MNGTGMVSLRDYEGVQGFGIGSMQDVENLNKALHTGDYARPVDGGGGGSVLRVESLESTLRVVTSTLQHVKLWPMLPKLPAFNTVEEYNVLKGYGNRQAGAFVAEGELPAGQDSDYERAVAFVKYLGTTREVTHPMTMVRPAHGNVIALETQNGTTWLLEQLEKALFNGRSDDNKFSIDGLAKQILDGVGVLDPNADLYAATDKLVPAAQTVVVDCRGGYIDNVMIERATNFVVENYGVPTDLWTTPKAMSSLAESFFPKERVTVPLQGSRVGLAVTEIVTQAGLVKTHQNIHLRSGVQGKMDAPAAATSTRAPSAPTVAAGSPASDAKSMFKAPDAGAYFYKVTACNRFGESAAATSASVTMAAGQGVTLTITDGGGADAATYYKVYRTAVGAPAAEAYLMTTVKRAGSGNTTVTDRNWFIPGCSNSMLVQNNLQNWSIRQLAPLMKIPLATIAASIRWMQLLYLTYILYTPRKNVLFINVKDDPQTVI